MYHHNTLRDKNIDTNAEMYFKYENTKAITNVFMVWTILLLCVAKLITSGGDDIIDFIINMGYVFMLFVCNTVTYLSLTVVFNSIITHYVRGYDTLIIFTGGTNILTCLLTCFLILWD